MGNDENLLPIPTGREVTQEVANLRHDLLVTLAVRVRLVDVRGPAGNQFGNRHPVESAVVALAQPLIPEDGNVGSYEGDGGCLHCAIEVGDEHRCEAVITAPLPKLARQLPPGLGEASGEPAGGHALLVVDGYRVRLID